MVRFDICIYLNFAYEKKKIAEECYDFVFAPFRLVNDYMDGFTRTNKNILILSCSEH